MDLQLSICYNYEIKFSGKFMMPGISSIWLTRCISMYIVHIQQQY